MTKKDFRVMSNLYRFNTTRRFHEQNLAEHSYYVTIIAYNMCIGLNLLEHERKYILEKALVHDIPEIHLGDITKLDVAPFIGNVDLVISGSPCTNLSVGGTRTGLDGEESALFYPFMEILKQVKPKYFLIENVASMTDKWRQIMTDIIGVEPIMIDSALVSAQSRERLFWCNWKTNLPQNKHIYLESILEPNADEAHYSLKTLYVNPSENREKAIKIGVVGQPLSTIQNYNSKDILIKRSTKDSQAQRVYSTKGKSVSLCSGGGGQGGKTGLYYVDGSVRKLTPLEACRLQTYDERCFEICPDISKNAWYEVFGNGFTVDVIVHLLNCLIYPERLGFRRNFGNN
jgi:DNA (cytosine-5)-methyltransferase 3A